MLIPNTKAYIIAVALFLVCCWVNPNDAIPYRTRPQAREQADHRVGKRTDASAAYVAHRAIGQPDLAVDRKPALSDVVQKWRDLQHRLSPRSRNKNVNINVNRNNFVSVPDRFPRVDRTNKGGFARGFVRSPEVLAVVDSQHTSETNMEKLTTQSQNYPGTVSETEASTGKTSFGTTISEIESSIGERTFEATISNIESSTGETTFETMTSDVESSTGETAFRRISSDVSMTTGESAIESTTESYLRDCHFSTGKCDTTEMSDVTPINSCDPESESCDSSCEDSGDCSPSDSASLSTTFCDEESGSCVSGSSSSQTCEDDSEDCSADSTLLSGDFSTDLTSTTTSMCDEASGDCSTPDSMSPSTSISTTQCDEASDLGCTATSEVEQYGISANCSEVCDDNSTGIRTTQPQTPSLSNLPLTTISTPVEIELISTTVSDVATTIEGHRSTTMEATAEVTSGV